MLSVNPPLVAALVAAVIVHSIDRCKPNVAAAGAAAASAAGGAAGLPVAGAAPAAGVESFPKNFWYEFTSPFTESYDDQEAADSVTEETPGEAEVTAEPLPFFENDGVSSNVTAQLGSTAILHCHVNDLRDKTLW
ncbi:hypothetical protein B566_EDAN013554 [Ephemera danica]|nr:hypothetical protein B566_EDAN013554 [Ephemera danica]